MPRRKKAPPKSLERLQAGNGYYSAEQRKAILKSLSPEIRDDFEPKAFIKSGGLGKTFTNDFFGCLEALADIYTRGGRASPPSKVKEDVTDPLRNALKAIIQKLNVPLDFTAINEVTRGAKLLAERGEGLRTAREKKADIQVRTAMDSLQWLVACLDEAIANPRSSPGRKEHDRHALIRGLVRLYEEAAANPSEKEKITFLETALSPLGALEDTTKPREVIRKILKKL